MYATVAGISDEGMVRDIQYGGYDMLELEALFKDVPFKHTYVISMMRDAIKKSVGRELRWRS